MRRRDFLKTGAAIAGSTIVCPSGAADVPDHLWSGYDFGTGPRVTDRLNQRSFAIEQDDGWYTVSTTTPSEGPVRNYGTGLIGYAWEESGPSGG